MTWAGKIIAAIVGGLMFAVIASMVVFIPIADKDASGWVTWLLLLAGAAVALMAPSAGKAWRRLLIMCGLATLAVPVSAAVFSVTNAQGSAGALVGGGMATMFTGVVAFFVAAIFLVVGLMVGKDRPS